jgi:hypothetical protein
MSKSKKTTGIIGVVIFCIVVFAISQCQRANFRKKYPKKEKSVAEEWQQDDAEDAERMNESISY